MGRFIISVAAIVVAAAAPAFAQAPGAIADVSGDYNGTFGATSLHQDGSHVTGTYAYDGGTIDGQLDGTVLDFSWAEASGSTGRGAFAVQPNGDLTGTWGEGNDDASGGAWLLTHGTLSAPDPTYFVDGSPHAGSWTRDLRMPFDVIVPFNGSGGGVEGGMIGLGVDLGYYVTDRWYLGGSADYEYLMYSGMSDGPDDIGNLSRERAAVEVRRYLDDNPGAMTVNCGPAQATPIHRWVGARAGVEWLESSVGTSTGEFADVSLGLDFQIGHTALGMYGSVTAAVDSPTAFATPDPGQVLALGMTFGMRVTLD